MALSPRRMLQHCGPWRLQIPFATLAAAVALPFAMSLATATSRAADPADHARTLWLEATLDPPTPYTQAQAIYTLRLYQAVSTRELQFHGPVAALADIRPIDGERISELTRNGQRYRVTERRYAIFPFASGDIALANAHVTAQVNRPGADTLQRIDAPATPFAALPIPAPAGTAGWIPARTLTLSEHWSPAPSAARSGQALRRTLRIEAKGVDAAQLPLLDASGTGYSAHPQAPRLDNRSEDGWTIGTREQTWLIVPTHPGQLTLPALQLPWWNVLTRQPQTASLPALTLDVGDGAVHTPPPAAPPSTSSATQQTGADTLTTLPVKSPDDNARLLLVTLATFAAVGLVALSLQLRRWLHTTAPLRRLRAACRQHDAQAARDALAALARLHGIPPPHSLPAIARELGEAPLAQALITLDRHLYGQPGPAWDGTTLLAALRSRHSWPARTRTRASCQDHRPPYAAP